MSLVERPMLSAPRDFLRPRRTGDRRDVLLRALRTSRGAGRGIRRVPAQADRSDRHRARGRHPGESGGLESAEVEYKSPQEASFPKPALPTDLPADPLRLLDSWLKEAFADIRNA